jgi:hypothetical protein
MRYLSMEYAPLRRKGKGGEVPQLHRRFLRLGEGKKFLMRPDRALTTPAPVIAKKPCILRGPDGPANQP